MAATKINKACERKGRYYANGNFAKWPAGINDTLNKFICRFCRIAPFQVVSPLSFYQ